METSQGIPTFTFNKSQSRIITNVSKIALDPTRITKKWMPKVEHKDHHAYGWLPLTHHISLYKIH